MRKKIPNFNSKAYLKENHIGNKLENLQKVNNFFFLLNLLFSQSQHKFWNRVTVRLIL